MSADDLRAATRAQWDAVAAAWSEHGAAVDAQARLVTAALLRATAPASGDDVLELAGGPGGVGLAAAPQVLPGGSVVVSDLAPGMVAAADERIGAAGLRDHVSARVLDLEAIDAPDGSFDVVVCRMGLMLAPSPARAAAEIARVLRPGGRVGVAVWGARAANPWLAVLLDAIGAQFGAEIPPPGMPGPFTLAGGEGDTLAALLRDAGFAGVTSESVDAPLRLPSADAWWEVVPSLAGPLAQLLRALEPADRDAIRARALDAIADFAQPDGVEAPGLALVAAGHRPG